MKVIFREGNAPYNQYLVPYIVTVWRPVERTESFSRSNVLTRNKRRCVYSAESRSRLHSMLLLICLLKGEGGSRGPPNQSLGCSVILGIFQQSRPISARSRSFRYLLSADCFIFDFFSCQNLSR